MIPVLYEQNETNFNTNGLGRLSDAISCTITEERNGGFELMMEYPIEGIHFSELRNARIIKATPADGRADQRFSIYRIDKLIGGKARVYAEHISYQAAYIPVMPFSAGSATAALVGLKTNAVATCPFTFSTDIVSSASFSQEKPDNMRSMMFGAKGSVLDVYGGEYEFDNLTILLRSQRGSDNGVTLRYGKNITDLSQENNITSTFTAIMPYAMKDEQVITLPEKTISASTAGNYPYLRVKTVDLSSEFEDGEEITVAKLRQKAQAYISSHGIGVPAVSVKVSFAALWQTEEYKDIAPLERVNLCDTVTVLFEELGVSTKAKVIKTEYNVLLDRYDSIEIGQPKQTISARATQEVNQKIEDSESMLLRAQKHATELITGGLGGHVVMKLNANGQPEEILIMDTDNMQTARKVWRFNLQGWGYSSTGVNGPYTLAATQDGEFVADFITAGTLNANIIKAGILTDTRGKFSLNMLTGDLVMNSGTFKGNVTGATITGSSITSTKTEGGVTHTTSINGGKIRTNDLDATGGSIQGTNISGSTITSTKTEGGTTKTTTISGGKITTNAIDATGGSIQGTNISGSTITSTKTEGGVTKTTTISGGKITTNNLDATGGKINGSEVTGATIQTAASGRRIKMDTSTSIKGMNGNTIDNLINLEQSVSGTNQMTIDARSQLNIRTPKLYVTNVSAGEQAATVYETYTEKDNGYNFISKVEKEMSQHSPWNCRELNLNGLPPEEEDYDVKCTLPVYLRVETTNFKLIHGMLLNDKTATSRVI